MTLLSLFTSLSFRINSSSPHSPIHFQCVFIVIIEVKYNYYNECLNLGLLIQAICYELIQRTKNLSIWLHNIDQETAVIFPILYCSCAIAIKFVTDCPNIKRQKPTGYSCLIKNVQSITKKSGLNLTQLWEKQSGRYRGN